MWPINKFLASEISNLKSQISKSDMREVIGELRLILDNLLSVGTSPEVSTAVLLARERLEKLLCRLDLESGGD